MFNALKNKTALYVEDELEVLENISELLKNYFKAFYKASNGEMGYEIFLEYKIDVILVDIELPKMNGIELIKKIRKKNCDIEIIVISAYTKTDYFLECIECQINKYIIKPLTSRKIKELLGRLNKGFEENVVNSKISLDNEFTFDTKLSELTRDDNIIDLTKKEKELLILFLAKKNSLISIANMEYTIWPDQASSPTRRRALVSRLRAKLQHRFIETCSSEGYIFRIEEQ